MKANEQMMIEDGDDEEGNKITNQNAEDNGFLAEGKQEDEEGNKSGEDEDEHDDKDAKNT